MKLIILLSILGIISLFAGMFKARQVLLPFVAISLAACLGLCFLYDCTCPDSFYDSFLPEGQFKSMLQFDRFSAAFTGLMLFSGLIVVLLSEKSLSYAETNRGDIYGLMLFSLAGAAIMVSYNHMVMLFLGIEILSIPLYILAGSDRRNLNSNEASLKYFLMGAFATCILLMGITLIYGATGSFSLHEIASYVQSEQGNRSTIFQVGMILLLVGLVFKIGAVPFHFWTPDVYTGAPTVITMFMATVAKIAGFGAFIIFFNIALNQLDTVWSHTLSWISAATILLGNFTATWQTSFKRMLAYSSIAHGGYALVALSSNASATPQSVYLYLVGYALASVITFAIVMHMERVHGSDDMNVLAGFGKREPLLAFTMTVALLSLAGIPPLIGFMGKYYMFTLALPVRPWLVIFAIIGSAVSIYYYFKPIMEAWFKSASAESDTPLKASFGFKALLLLCTLALLVLGLAPHLILELIS